MYEHSSTFNVFLSNIVQMWMLLCTSIPVNTCLRTYSYEHLEEIKQKDLEIHEVTIEGLSLMGPSPEIVIIPLV